MSRPEFPALPTGPACPAEVEVLLRHMLAKDARERATMREVVRSGALQTPEPHSSLERLVGVSSKPGSRDQHNIAPVSISKLIGDSKFPSSKYIAEAKNQPDSTTSLDLQARHTALEQHL